MECVPVSEGPGQGPGCVSNCVLLRATRAAGPQAEGSPETKVHGD